LPGPGWLVDPVATLSDSHGISSPIVRHSRQRRLDSSGENWGLSEILKQESRQSGGETEETRDLPPRKRGRRDHGRSQEGDTI